MNFEFDQAKSESNRAKHGVNFLEAQALWNDSNAVVAKAKNVEGEERWFRIAKLVESLYLAVYTMRGDAIRLISVRPAHEKERALYEKENQR